MSNYSITDLDSIGDLAAGDIFNDTNTGDFLAYTGTNWTPTKINDPVSDRLDRLEKLIEKIADRLAILEEPDEERLEQFKTLQDIYKKYKFADALCGKDKENGD